MVATKRAVLVWAIIGLWLAACAQGSVAQQNPAQVPTQTAAPTEQPCVIPLPVLSQPKERPALTGDQPVRFRVMHLNDQHADLVENIDLEGGFYAPGAAALMAVVKQERAQAGAASSLLLDAGDWSEGASPWMKIPPTEALAFYQRLGVDAVTVGNHEFFHGLESFVQVLSAQGAIQVLGANLRINDPKYQCHGTNQLTNAYHIFELAGSDGGQVRVAVLGLGMKGLQKISFAGGPIIFDEPLDEVRDFYKNAYPLEKPDVVVLLTHMGYDLDQSLAQTLNEEGIAPDLIVGGHSHTWIDAPALVGKTVVVTAGDYGRALGVLDLQYERATDSLKTEWRLRKLQGCDAEDPAELALLREKFPRVYSSLNIQTLQKNKGATEVWVKFGQETESSGLWVKQEEGDDGTTQMVEKGGKPAVTSADGSNYIYFDANTYLTQCQGRLEVEVEYYDAGFGPLVIEYDRAPNGPQHPCADCYFPATITTLGNTGTWKTATIVLADATFNGNQKWSTDFRLTGWDKPLFLAAVKVRKLGP